MVRYDSTYVLYYYIEGCRWQGISGVIWRGEGEWSGRVRSGTADGKINTTSYIITYNCTDVMRKRWWMISVKFVEICFSVQRRLGERGNGEFWRIVSTGDRLRSSAAAGAASPPPPPAGAAATCPASHCANATPPPLSPALRWRAIARQSHQPTGFTSKT